MRGGEGILKNYHAYFMRFFLRLTISAACRAGSKVGGKPHVSLNQVLASAGRGKEAGRKGGRQILCQGPFRG